MGSNKQMDVSCVQVKKMGAEDGPLRNAEENRMRNGNQPNIGNLLCSAVQEWRQPSQDLTCKPESPKTTHVTTWQRKHIAIRNHSSMSHSFLLSLRDLQLNVKPLYYCRACWLPILQCNYILYTGSSVHPGCHNNSIRHDIRCLDRRCKCVVSAIRPQDRTQW